MTPGAVPGSMALASPLRLPSRLQEPLMRSLHPVAAACLSLADRQYFDISINIES